MNFYEEMKKFVQAKEYEMANSGVVKSGKSYYESQPIPMATSDPYAQLEEKHGFGQLNVVTPSTPKMRVSVRTGNNSFECQGESEDVKRALAAFLELISPEGKNVSPAEPSVYFVPEDDIAF